MKYTPSLFASLIFVSILILIPFKGIAQLSGTYTIGGTSPDYATVNAAVSDLLSSGVSGPVTFNIRAGTYTEQITLNAVTGASATNVITFQSETMNASDVTIQHNSGSTNNWVVRLDDARYLTFQHLTLKSLSGSHGYVFRLETFTRNITIQNCIIEGQVPAFDPTYPFMTLINDDSGTHYFLKILGNTFINGSRGFYFNSISDGLELSNNRFTGFTYYGVHIINALAPKVDSNYIHSTSTESDARALILSSCDNGLQVTNNTVISTGTSAICFQLSDNGGTSSLRGKVFNNQISHNGTTTSNSIAAYLISNEYLDFDFNSVVNNCAYSPSYGILEFSPAAIDNRFRDNHIVNNVAGGYGFWVDPPAIVTASDHNNIYAPSGITGYWSADRNTLADFQSASGMDSNSVSMDPMFAGVDSLIPGNPLLENLGTPIPGIFIDIEGTPRDVSTPDIGAWETAIPVFANDAGVESIDTNLCSGSDSVYVSIQNFGTDTLTSVSIEWEVDGVPQTPYSWSGSLPQDSVSNPISIGIFTFSAGASYSISAWTNNPNGTTDEQMSNDSLSISGLSAAMNGVYTIGGGSPDYADITSAVTDLNALGVCGPVTFNLRTGTYSEQNTIVEFPGSSPTNTVTFRAETGNASDVLIQFTGSASDNYIFQLDGADHLIFEQLSFQANASSYAHVFDLMNGTEQISILDCEIAGPAVSVTDVNTALIHSVSGSENNLLIEGNRIRGGGYGIYLSGPLPGLEVNKNDIDQYYNSGIYLETVHNAIVDSNTVHYTGINTFANPLFLNNCDSAVKLSRNTVYVDQTSNYGLRLDNCTGTVGARPEISNNIVSMNGTGATSSYGLTLNNSASLDIVYNTFHNGRNVSSIYVVYQFGGGSSDLVFRNNQIVNEISAGYGMYFTNTGVISSSDYNNIFTFASTGFWGSVQSTLTDWQTATGMDANSIAINPNFASPTDFHPTNPLVDNLGTPFPGITEDISGTPRDAATPDIGVWEAEALSADAGMDQSGCAGTSFLMSGSGSGLSGDYTYEWMPGGWTTDTVTVSPDSTTDYVLTVTDTASGSTSSDTLRIEVLPAPVVEAGNDTSICAGDTLSLTATGNPAWAYLWQPGSLSGATQSFSPDSSSLYSVSATDSNLCTGTDSVMIMVNDPPAAGFGFSSTGLTVSFSDSSMGGNTWFWDFGDGDTSSIANPSHTYAVSDTYLVCLRVVDSLSNCEDSVCQAVNVLMVNAPGLISQPGIDIYPNPTRNTIIVEIQKGANSNSMIKVFDLSGKLQLIHPITQPTSKVHIGHLQPGYYLVEIIEENQISFRQKVLKLK